MGAGHRRTKNDSLAAAPTEPGRAVHLFCDERVKVRAEIADAVDAVARSAMDAAMIQSEIWARVRAAGRGQLRDSEDLVPVRTQPELWELRWKPHGVDLRMYHAEPGGDPAMVGLLFHRKTVDGLNGLQIEAAQDAKMDEAATRLTSGRHALWGHSRRGCQECIVP